MMRPFRSVAFALAGSAMVLGGFGGCAIGERSDLEEGAGPALPGFDAASEVTKPKPYDGAGDDAATDASATPRGDAAAADASSVTPPDAGPTVWVDASVVDAASTLPKPSPGELLISEIMYNTFGPEPASEWFELHSIASGMRSLSGLVIKDSGGRTHTIGAGVTIAPAAFVVLVRKRSGAIAAKVPTTAIVYDYGGTLPDNAGILLANSAAAAISILNGPVVLATAAYGGWFSQSGGSSVQLHAIDPSLASAKESWCLSMNSWLAGSDKGTPGAADDCP